MKGFFRLSVIRDHLKLYLLIVIAFQCIVASNVDASESPASQLSSLCDAHETAWFQYHSRKIFHEIGGDDVKAFFGFTPILEVFRYEKPYTGAHSGGSIHISTAMMHLVEGEDELAFLLSHELAHYLLMHHQQYRINTPDNYEELEIEADNLALSLMSQAGYDTKAAFQLLHRLSKYRFGDSELTLSDIYPTLAARQGKLAINIHS